MATIILKILLGVVYVYLLWRTLKEDYLPEKLISFGWVSLLGFVVGGRIGYGLVNWGVWNDSFWDWCSFWDKGGFIYAGAYIGFLVVTYLFCLKSGWKLWAFLEELTLLGLGLLTVLALVDGVWLLAGAMFLTGLVLVWILKSYRSFVWYRSGKKGFGFLAANFILFLLLFLLSWFFGQAKGRWLYLIWGLISLLGLVILGELNEKKG